MLSQHEEYKTFSFYTARKTSPDFYTCVYGFFRGKATWPSFTLVYMVSSSNAYIFANVMLTQQQKFAEYDGLIS
jgi:hypothetical protein